MALEKLYQALREDPEWEKTITHHRRIEGRPGNFEALPESLDPSLKDALIALGIDELYSHQAESFTKVQAGKSLVVTTPTASGKSLCYHLPVLDHLLKNTDARALYLFPTKALSRDQVASLSHVVAKLSRKIAADVYDGDTPGDVRRHIRRESDIVVTNPYMLHAGVLPNHTQWERMISGLKFVVIDELHLYTGVFGSHMANVLRRLKRVCQFYGSDPVYILCSATIANPKALGERLCERKLDWISENGAPLGPRDFYFINPPIVQPELGLRRSGVEQARRLALPILHSGVQALFFERTRNGVEILVKYLKDTAIKHGYDPKKIAGYRGGYLPELRREIERGLRSGTLQMAVATNALELGVDIGSLDTVVLVGYPGSVASTFQRAGRAGRRQSPSVVFLVAKSTATDQYVNGTPDYLFGDPSEHAAIDPDNLIIRLNHLKCAAFELPFREGDEFGGEGDTAEVLDYLEREVRILKKASGKYHWAAQSFPAENVPLDAGDVDNFVVYDVEKRSLMAQVDRPSAMTTIHQEAIYNHQGDQYYIERMDYEGRRAYARRVDVDYFTEAVIEADIKVRHIDRDEPLPFASASLGRRLLGEVGVSKVAPMYKKIRFYTRENVGSGDIQLPPENLETEAMILVFEEEPLIKTGLLRGGAAGSFNGAAALMRRVVPLFVRCNPSDIGVDTEIKSPHFEKPTLYLWDEIPGGVGLSDKAFTLLGPIVDAMLDVARQCPCVNGCPACIGAVLGEEPRDKTSVIRFLLLLARGEQGAGDDRLAEVSLQS